MDEPRIGMWSERVRVSVGRVLVREPWIVRALGWVLITAAMVVAVLIAIPIAVLLLAIVLVAVTLVAIGRVLDWMRRAITGRVGGVAGGSQDAARRNVRVIGPTRAGEWDGPGPDAGPR